MFRAVQLYSLCYYLCPGLYSYIVSITTGTVDSSSTDANIYIVLYGNGVDSGNEQAIDTPNWNDFQSGQ